ncbi:MAG: hypothetical protein ABI348_08050, partial [Nitrososphaera sp.]
RSLGVFILLGEKNPKYAFALLNECFVDKEMVLVSASLLSGLRRGKSEGLDQFYGKIGTITHGEQLLAESFRFLQGIGLNDADKSVLTRLCNSENEKVRQAGLDAIWKLSISNSTRTSLDVLAGIKIKNIDAAGAILSALFYSVYKKDVSKEIVERIKPILLELNKFETYEFNSYHIESLLKIISVHDPYWQIDFVESYLDRKRQLYQHSSFDIKFSFPNARSFSGGMERLFGWYSKGDIYRMELRRFVKEVSETVTPELASVMDKWISTRDLVKLQTIAFILGAFKDNDDFYTFIPKILNNSNHLDRKQRDEIRGQIASSLHTGAISRTVGEPSQDLIRKRDGLRKLIPNLHDMPDRRFIEDIAKDFDDEIQNDLKEDKQFGF